MKSSLLAILAFVRSSYAASVKRASPIVVLDDGTFIGTTTGAVNSWLGIPFAQPPVGNLRFAKPVANNPYNGTRTVTAYGPACPQQAITLPLISGLPADTVNFIVNTIFGAVFPDDEDCLTINVIVLLAARVAPTSATPSSKLPVVVWIFGGGFELGSPSMVTGIMAPRYPGQPIVQRSIDLGEPVVYVSMNYRVSAFGFLASQEVKDAGVGNLGLRDQRLALQWVQKYISNFGGDPTKVTIWGESAGAISVAMQMITNGANTEGLFRAGFMQSGSPIPVGDITHGQTYYDFIVGQTGCASSSDTLQCLRGVPYQTLKDAVDKTPDIFSYQSLVLAWLPRVDGDFLTTAPQQLVQQGSVADIPFINGDCDDEGTLFSLANANITTEAEVATYINTYYLPEASSAQVSQLLAAYPADPADGSPFNTGSLNAITPQFKRLAAMQGDVVFNAPRRFFIQAQAGKQKVWSYSCVFYHTVASRPTDRFIVHKRLKALPVLGAGHGTDILDIYGGTDMTDYLIHFAVNLDPNGVGLLQWPQYSTAAPTLLTFLDGLATESTEQDTFRAEGFNILTNLSLQFPL
ncbi:carotenoid ester lipase precursor [Vararia minispora EC-137]|uniref:Carotenoid ester lipase n=1 Tax=Vararia minispora EC-137 TaxID=1314806 RepID=A0ACB8QWS4_9AGAM|nr:carotenoid ester lipase precursor [Vararia minispora EC-137]